MIAALAIESEAFDIVSAVESPGHDAIGSNIGELAGIGAFGVYVADRLEGEPEVVIDFTSPEGTLHWLDASGEKSAGMVIGTTGLTPSQQATVADAASSIAIVQAANMSIGINVLLKVVAQLAATLGDDYDIEISETHHPSANTDLGADMRGDQYGEVTPCNPKFASCQRPSSELLQPPQRPRTVPHRRRHR